MKTILLVDDSRVTREVLKVYLIPRGVDFLEAVDGADALVRARARRPDLVVADLRMPKLDGPGLCAAMRADRALRDVPVIILTGVRDAESAKRCLEAGAREVLLKPIQPGPLLESVSRYLDARPSPPGGTP